MTDSASLVSREWFRYGKRRVYVNSADGAKVGWMDLATGERVLDDPAYESEFTAFLDEYLASRSVESVRSQPVDPVGQVSDAPVDDEVSTVAQPSIPPVAEDAVVEEDASRTNQTLEEELIEPAWVDLTGNRPGQGIRQKAEEELAAMKAKSRLSTFFIRTFDVHTEERAYRVGADGEETVGARLEKLTGHGWHVLHSVPVGELGSDIDHILVGPGGVFSINTKMHPGGRVWVGRYSIKVNGHSQPYLRNSRFEGRRASKFLTRVVGWDVAVEPVLIFLTGTWIPNVTIKQQPDDVWVLDRIDVPRVFKKRRPVLSDDQVSAVFDAARRSTTWTSG